MGNQSEMEVQELQETMIEEGVHNYSEESDYIYPTEEELLERLEWFKDQKIGLMMHWGIYSQIGLVESWALSDQDGDWSRHDVDWTDDMEMFKEDYFHLNQSFNPIRFQPKKWAQLAKDAGFRYLTFTTKHHDGFCMWDTKYTDYKVTDDDCPFHKNPNADICKHVFDAFREQGLAISAYFSKADWASPCYWVPEDIKSEPTWRGPSYSPVEKPDLWEQFVQFTHNQVKELCYDYGKIDMLWFDAGWVCPQSKVKQDIRMGELIDEIRETQPWMLCADRTVGGAYENVITPEQCVPEKPLSVPWESNITMGKGFAFTYEDNYKNPRQVINLLVDIVSKGGNLALNVAPQPDGRLPRSAIETMKGMGEWLSKYGEAIYETRPCEPYKVNQVAFTKKEDQLVYALYMYPDANEIPKGELFIPYTKEINKIELLGYEEKIDFTRQVDGIVVTLPETAIHEIPIAHVLKLHVDR
ncbi:alpha-L-fucosidase [Vallitalea okinawensis]|uniref:alpha-L-fucosidase n=1 Tax=Vallitalea okinawensis TaxID=2078660 RepID=UPI001FA926F6|nr:alpha-L-fucosidase [Vallitalea okinawensis]